VYLQGHYHGFWAGGVGRKPRIGTLQMRQTEIATKILTDRTSRENGEVHVWNAPLADECDTGELSKLLDPEEQGRAAAFAFDLDRIRYVHSHSVLRQILSRYTDREPGRLVFARSPYQKPRLVREQREDPDLHFSLSHSNRCCLVAVRVGSPVGADVEHLRDLPEAASIAARWFTRAESDALAHQSGAALQRAFFGIWTHREAVIKALGVNLEIGFRQLECALDPAGAVHLVSWRGDETIGRRWRVRRLEPVAGYLGALATLKHFDSLRCLTWDGDASAEAIAGG
jgi:4'-phosphopantetheinyl transferase